MKKSDEVHHHVLFHLPQEIIEEILPRLPVKSLLRFRCVSKSWLSLIESDRFIKIHMQSSTTHRVIYNVKDHDVLNGGCVQSLLHSNSKERSSSTTTHDPPKKGIILESFNGVLCLYNHHHPSGRDFMLWNPATRVSRELPELGHTLPKCGFGWDESSGAYKVFATALTPYNGVLSVSSHVYSCKTDSWKQVPCVDSFSLCDFIGLFLHGRIHRALWNGDGEEHAIESFDLGSDEVGRIELPPVNANGFWPSTRLGKIEGCLCILVDYKRRAHQVWVMKEYGVKDSWFKRLTFRLDLCLSNNMSPFVIGEGPNGEIFVVCRNNILRVYSPRHGFFSKVADFDHLTGLHVYVESLVSPRRILGGTNITEDEAEEEESSFLNSALENGLLL